VPEPDLVTQERTDSCTDDCGCASSTSLLTTADPRLRRWAWGLTALTIGWNSLEAVIAIGSGLLAGSIALVGFGLDSVVEVGSALVIVWRLSLQGGDQEANERAEKRAVRLIALKSAGRGRKTRPARPTPRPVSP
jgi:hypothetical protein